MHRSRLRWISERMPASFSTPSISSATDSSRASRYHALHPFLRALTPGYSPKLGGRCVLETLSRLGHFSQFRRWWLATPLGLQTNTVSIGTAPREAPHELLLDVADATMFVSLGRASRSPPAQSIAVFSVMRRSRCNSDHQAPLSGVLSLVSLPRFLEPLGPIGECREEASQPLAGLFVPEVAVSGSNFWREKDEYLRFGHYIGWGMQEYLPQDHLSACRPLLLGSP